MENVKTVIKSVDSFQRSHGFLGFPVAVIKRYSDDKAGRKAALLTYYAFLSLFPLLIVFVSALSFLVSNHPGLESQVMRHVYQLFPALGGQIAGNISSLHQSGLALLLQVLVIIYGARGLASILQETFNDLWHISPEHRPGFWADHYRSIGMMLSVGFAIIIGSSVGYALTSVVHLGWLGTILLTLANVALTFGLFLSVFRLGTSNKVSLGKLTIGAAVATISTILVQRFGVYIMSHELHRLEGSYGSFAFALGVLFWIYLQVQVILYSIVITIVRTECDWPKKLF